MTEAPVLAVRGARKHFGGVNALDDVDFDLRAGEIHALLGENGAGKSTLVKLLAGVVHPDDGNVLVCGEPLPPGFSPADVTAAGIAFVHQDLGLLDHMSVAENIALSTGYRHGRTRLIRFRETERAVAGDLERLGLGIRASTSVQRLAQDEKVMVAVARAFALDARAIVLDEVTSSLPAPEAARLADALRSTRSAGLGIVYVTHRIDEIFGLADRVTVLRNGRRAVTADVAGTDHDQIVEWILGAEAASAVKSKGAHRRPRRAAGEAPRVVVRDLRCSGLHEAVSLEVSAGEILGVCGLVGCGARALAAALGGALVPSGGSATLDGTPLPLGNPEALRARGCTYVPGDRQGAGGVFTLSVRENLFMTRGGSSAGIRFLPRPRAERADARRLAARFDIRPRGRVDQPLGALSGGNQQKAVLGRALRGGPSLLVVDDPTAGVDIGSRAQVHAIVHDAAEAGCAVVLASTDFDEVAAHADRALVMWHGRVAAELTGDELTSNHLARASYGPRPRAAGGEQHER